MRKGSREKGLSDKRTWRFSPTHIIHPPTTPALPPWRLINRYGLPQANAADGYFDATAGDHEKNPPIHPTHLIERSC
eukprot:scaffold28955_cov65-Cyclotella_meneghiniana.AAC.5